jgi:hypothetical protein
VEKVRLNEREEPDMIKFLANLKENGRVVVDTSFGKLDPTEALPALEELDQVARANMAFTAPEFSESAACWAVAKLYRACQLVVCRDASEADMVQHLAGNCPEPHSPSADYSVDLVFQYLPDVMAIAKRLSSADPLVRELLVLARAWPLSSVGVENIEKVSIDSFIDHPGLRQLYVDRILARSDMKRMGDSRVNLAIKEALGAFPELSPAAAAMLDPTKSL